MSAALYTARPPSTSLHWPPLRPRGEMLMAEERAILQNTWFQGLRADVQQAVLGSASIRRVRAGTPLLRMHAQAEAWYGLARGAVRIGTPLETGRRLTLGLLKPGEWFGDVSVLDDGPPPWEAETCADSTLLWVPRGALLELLDQHPSLGVALARLNSQRARQFTQMLAGAVSQPLRQRVAGLLLDIARRFGDAQPEGQRVHLRLSQQDMADMLGVCRQRVNACLKQLEREDLFKLDEGHLLLPSPQRLARVAAQG